MSLRAVFLRAICLGVAVSWLSGCHRPGAAVQDASNETSRETSNGAWTGTWTLDASSAEQPRKPTFTLALASSGEYVWTIGDKTFRFRCDGRDYPDAPRRSVACIQRSPAVMETVYRVDGKDMSRTLRELSADGKTLSVTATLIRKDGSEQVKKLSYTRISQGTGFEGAWKSSSVPSTAETLVIQMTDTAFHMMMPATGQHADIPLTGGETALEGAPTGAQVTLSAARQSPHRMLLTKKVNGQAISETSLELSPDGSTLVEETWRPESPAVKDHLVFKK